MHSPAFINLKQSGILSTMQSLSTILLKQKKIKKAMKNTMILHRFRHQWKTVSTVLVRNTSIVSVHDQTVTIGVYTATWKQEIVLMTPALIARFGKWFPDIPIQTVQCTLLTRPKKRKHKPLVVKATTLEASIQSSDNARRASGQQLCSHCMARYSYTKLCTICQSKQQYQELHNQQKLCNN